MRWVDKKFIDVIGDVDERDASNINSDKTGCWTWLCIKGTVFLMFTSEQSGKNTKSITLRVVAILLVFAFVSGAVLLVDRIKKVELDWDDYSTHLGGESELLSRLYSHMGYGGFIHNLKNYILRQDGRLLKEVESNMHDMLADIDEYESEYIVEYEGEMATPQDKATAAMLRANHQIIREVMGQYVSKLEIAKMRISEGISTEELDQLFYVDDVPALTALNFLSKHIVTHANGEVIAIRKKTDSTIQLIVVMLVSLVSAVIFLLYMVMVVNRQYLKSKMIAEENKDALDSILNSLSDSVITVDSRSHLVWTNGAVKEMFGYEPGELIGKNINRLLPGEIKGTHHQLFENHLSNPDPGELGVGTKLKAIRKGGASFPVEIALNSVTLNGNTMSIATIHDITERTNYEKKIEALNQSLIRNNRELNEINKALESFSYSVSHDLRGPLRAIGGFSSLLTEKYKNSLDEDAQDYLARIRSSSKRMSELIDSLLNLSRYVREGIELSDCNLSEISVLVYNRINDAADAAYDANVEIQDDLHVIADCNLMDVVLYNLLSNALKFTRKRKDAHVEVGMFTPEGGQKTYFVSDNGEGFDMAYADRLFLPFHQLHQAGEYEGSGIGLATVQRIIRRLGGRVWADSKPGVGTTFYFTLSNPHEEMVHD